ncbi:MAG: diacylglycerol kinase family lipid kinase [Tissierellia bacterium]|nr:diacylglycerol kinase family lipid kinase [Tissierellia bacterium]
MKKVKIIANPTSGREYSLLKVNQLINYMSEDPWDIHLLFTHKRGDGIEYAKHYHGEDLIVCCGGDGTLNEVVNGIYQSGRDTPLAILPSGTVNDFGTYLDLPQDAKSFYKLLCRNHKIHVDMGLAGDRAFINVAAGGLLTEVAYTVSEDSKAVLGRIAYYVEGAKEILGSIGRPREGVELEVTVDDKVFSVNATLFIIANSTSVGGFKNLAPTAEIHDGLMDVIILKNVELNEALEILGSFTLGKHIHHDKVIYIQTDEISIKSDRPLIVDVDGEKTGELPMTFRVVKNALTLLI